MQHDRAVDSSDALAGTTITRRGFLELAGLAVGGAALPSGAAAALPSSLPAQASTGVSPVMKNLSAYMTGAGSSALPKEVVEAAKQHILDTFAAMISGCELLPGRDAIQFAHSYGGEKVSTVVASDILCGPIEAALVNGILAHSDETDDSQAPSQSHPGCAVVPAALATAERFGISGTHFLRAVTLGYDIGTRFTMTLGGQKFEAETHWSTHSISPLFGATAAAGCAAGLNDQQMRWLIGYSAQQSSGLAAWHRDTQHIQKAFVFAGMNARSGVTSALLVQAGWTGVEDILSGADSFFLAYNPQADPAGLIDQLGERFEITRTNIKKWPVGSPIQGVLDAIVILRRQRPFDAKDVQQLAVRLAKDEAAIVNNREMPDISLQQMVAVMLLDKTVTFRSAHDSARMQDAAVLRERAKIRLIPDEQLERLMPLRVASVDVTLTDGSHLTRRVDNVRGTPPNPMTREEVVTKARDLIIPVLGESKCSLLIESILNLENVKDIRELRPLLQRS